MNKNIINSFFALCLFFTFVSINSCGDVANLDNTIGTATGARVRFFHASSGGSPMVVTQNGQKWTSVLSTAKYTDSIVYGGSYPVIDYSLLPAGQTKFTAKLPFTASNKDTTVAELTGNLEDGKYHIVIAADTFPTPKLYLIPDIRVDNRNPNKTYFRFANFFMKSPTTGFDCYLNRQPNQSFANLKYGEASQYVEFEPSTAIPDTLFLRVPGTTANVVTLAFGATKFAANRSAIVIFRGVLGGTGTKVPAFTLLTSN